MPSAGPYPSPPAPWPQAPTFWYAGFWVRALAAIVDGFVLVLVWTLMWPLIIRASAAGTLLSLLPGLALLGVLIQGIYYVATWSTGGTMGMRLLRLRIVDEGSGGEMSARQVVIRLLGVLLAGLPCYLGWIWTAFDHRKQGWHDKLAHTLVIHLTLDGRPARSAP